MPFDRFLIAPLNTGLQTNLKPWLISDDAFAQLNNAYVFRGRVRKRFGSTLMGTTNGGSITEPLVSRLRVLVNTTNAFGNAAGTVPGNIFAVGQAFSIGDEVFTVQSLGTPTILATTGSAVTRFYFTNNGFYNFGGAAALTPVYFYPAQPVMGLCNYEVGPINNQPSFAFDTQFAYQFSGSSWVQFTQPIWHGSNDNFFWTCNWEDITSDNQLLFVTNFNATVGVPGASDDPFWYYDGTNWTTFNPIYLTTGAFVQTSQIIVAFKGRLILLNTIENIGGANYQFKNRARWSFVGSPLAVNAWLEPNQTITVGPTTYTAAGAGFADATTEEAIVSAEFIKDRLIVYFERSTWELAWTGNQEDPFQWQKINTELGSEATFSSVPFDKEILTIGNTGVHSCNGANVERIDKLIPDEVFNIVNKAEGVQRIAGIRDYYVEMVYWTFPSDQDPSLTFPNRVLVYNYRNGAWAFNDDCITCFGYFEQQQGVTWDIAQGTWSQANYSWDSGVINPQFRQIIMGNQEGFVTILQPNVSRNAPSMQITNLTIGVGGLVTIVAINHVLQQGDFIAIENTVGINLPIQSIYKVNSIIDADTFTIIAPDITGSYLGGGTLARVSNLGILSKQWNPYVQKDRNVYLSRIDFNILKTSDGEVTVDYYPSYTNLSMLAEASNTNMIMGTGVLETSPYPDFPLEQQQTLLWHPVYFQTSGESIQIFIYMNDTQITNPTVAWSDFELEAALLHTQPTTARLQ